MDIDMCPSSSTDLAPFIDENAENINTKERVMSMLDTLESHVEKLRRDAGKLEEDKDNILASIDTVKMLPALNDLVGLEKDEAFRYLDRIVERCQTVEVNVYTQRDREQEEALHQVNLFIDNLVVMFKSDADGARTRCMTYMNACSSQSVGIADKHFESVLLGCTIDDQKRVKKRLQGLLKYLDKLGIVTEV